MNMEKVHWNFDNSYQHLSEIFFKEQKPSPVKTPQLVILNGTLAKELGLSNEELQSKAGVEVFAGNRIPKNAVPIAQAYAGHQFGHFTDVR